MDFLGALPLEVLHGVGQAVPSTRDLFSLSLVNQYSRNSLTVPVLFKWRLEQNGWDVEVWEKYYPIDNFHNEWFRIDYIHSRLGELFEQAITDHSAITLFVSTTSSRGSLSSDTTHGAEILKWLEDVSGLLPAVVLHHASRNVPRLTQVKYWPIWNTMFRIVDELCSQPKLPTIKSDSGTSHQLTRETLDLLALALAAVAHSAESTQLLDMHGSDHWSTVMHGPRRNVANFVSSFFPRLTSNKMRLHWQTMHRQLSSVLCASSFIRVKLLSERRTPRSNIPIVTILPPSPPFSGPDIANFRWVDVIDPQKRQTSFTFAIMEALKTEGSWFGYYSQGHNFDPVMKITILPDNSGTSGATVTFEGTGWDAVDSFSLKGTIDVASGVLEAEKHYLSAGFTWRWAGLVTPFGLVGKWGYPGDGGQWGGWWWIWPAGWNTPSRKVSGK
ncbi:hypothetical protein DFH09DRAFT_185097 [Mycena vulgaris]|nr:hypothetical protein DFH09DRAFT_185097 [Mycena vulgaris]